jgi:hypothetical protein
MRGIFLKLSNVIFQRTGIGNGAACLKKEHGTFYMIDLLLDRRGLWTAPIRLRFY